MLFDAIREILMDLLDLEAEAVAPESYLVRDLDAESIDFLELAVALNERFHIPVHDDSLFLRNLRLHLAEARDGDHPPLAFLKSKYGWLSGLRIAQMLADLEGGPVLQVRDLAEYVQWQMNLTQAA